MTPANGTLTLPPGSKEAFDTEVAYWTDYFKDPAKNGGLTKGAVSDPEELRKLTAFFVWTAWASAAQRPGTTHSYTNNFPYDPLVGNHPTGGDGALERGQPAVPAGRHRDRAARLRQVRLPRLARRSR